MASPKPFVVINWNDAEDFREAGWANEEDVNKFNLKPCPVTSIGWLVSKTRSHVSIAADFTPTPDTYGRIIKIPRKMIQSIEEVDLITKQAPKSPA